MPKEKKFSEMKLYSFGATTYYTGLTPSQLRKAEQTGFIKPELRGGGKYMYAYERDRSTALQIMLQAHGVMNEKSQEHLRRQFYVQFAAILIANNSLARCSSVSEVKNEMIC